MVPVLPVLFPQVVGGQGAEDEGGDDGTVEVSMSGWIGVVGALIQLGPGLGPAQVQGFVLDGELAPEVYRPIASAHRPIHSRLPVTFVG